jgi:hypothetical protein
LSFRRSRSATGFFDVARRWLFLSRVADDCLPPLCFECLAKIMRLDFD